MALKAKRANLYDTHDMIPHVYDEGTSTVFLASIQLSRCFIYVWVMSLQVVEGGISETTTLTLSLEDDPKKATTRFHG